MAGLPHIEIQNAILWARQIVVGFEQLTTTKISDGARDAAKQIIANAQKDAAANARSTKAEAYKHIFDEVSKPV